MTEREIPKWIERVKAVSVYYAAQCRENPEYTLAMLSADLKRSKGRLSEDLMLVRFMKTHPRVETFRNIRDAVDYCNKIKKDRKMSV